MGYFSQEELDAFRTQSLPAVGKAAPKKKKGFWQDQISTGGGIGGAVAGSAIGTAILPGIGTLAGAILGGAIGGGGGQLAENSIVGEDDITKDVFKEATLNGIFAAPPIRGAAAVLKGGKAALSGAGGRAANEAVTGALTSNPIRSAVAGKFGGGKVAELGTDLRRNVANTTKVADSFSEETQILDSLNRAGLRGSATKQYKEVGPALGNISDSISAKLSTIPGTVNKVDALATLRNGVLDAVPSTNQHGRELSNALERLSKSKTGETLTADDIFRFKQELGSGLSPVFTKLKKGGSLTPRQEVEHALWSKLDDEIIKLAPDVKRMTLDQSNLLKAQSGLQAASQKTLGIPLVGIKSQGAERIAQNVRDTTGRVLQGVGGESTRSLPGVFGTGARLAGVGAVTGSINQAMNPQPMDESLMPQDQFGDLTSALNDPMLEQPTNPFGVSQEEVAAQMMVALQAGDKTGFTQLKEIYDLIGETQEGPKTKAMGVEAQKMMNNAQAGLQSLTSLEQMIAEDPSLVTKAALPGNALTDSVLGTSKYRAAIQNVQDAMSRLRSGASMTQQESDRFDKMLPRLGDTPDTVAYKIAQFKDYFSGVLATEANTYGPTTLDEALLQ